MASGAVRTNGRSEIADLLVAQVERDGSVGHTYASAPALRRGMTASRNLADVVHHFCMLHGRYPGIIDMAAMSCADAPTLAWLSEAKAGFGLERGYLARLVVAAGPLPSTPGQAETESVLFSQRHAIETLARSERTGCAVGAAMALTLDWRAIRPVLDLAADRFGVSVVPLQLPSVADSLAVANALATTLAIQRAIGFGAQQLLLQHRGLWSLLEAREAARRTD